ncbi:hypothetical protein [Candidatus Methanoperedens nitratireducens]|uniref:Uncharacterized protein n=1 Tax=Candidatus Methanoperedens nitratireducens TaxID=1392998 RepID=A0A284VRP9_9EURY|nr:hypothetical protein [Candidatus Methanoperedens nitroreducens]SNQ61888.1 hypothetical protein MNV_510004 [Candidatus Methanoperedens nitroreducens]
MKQYDAYTLDLLNALAWHVFNVGMLADLLNAFGVSEDDIDAFLKEYEQGMKEAPSSPEA